MEANLIFAALIVFMVGTFGLLGAIIWVLNSQGDKQRQQASKQMETFEVAQKSTTQVIANTLREMVSPMVNRLDETFEITEVGFKDTSKALDNIKETQAKELALDMDTKALLESVAKDIGGLQGKVATLENSSNLQLSELKEAVASLKEDLNTVVQLVKAQIEKAKSE